MSKAAVVDPFEIEGQTTVEEQVEEALDGTEMSEGTPEAPLGGRTANQRYGAAQRALREAYPDQFTYLLQQEYLKDGLEYRPRLTAEERARLEEEEKRARAKAKIEAIRAEFPDLDV